MRFEKRLPIRGRLSWFAAAALTSLLAAGCSAAGGGEPTLARASAAASSPAPGTSQDRKLAAQSPYRGYLQAHDNLETPLAVLGGSTQVTIQQDGGEVHVALPDYRRLDPDVFGTPSLPRAYGGTAIAEGVPPDKRETSHGHYTQLDEKTPFGHANIVLGHGQLNVTLNDATATDAAQTDDSVQFEASWQDQAGNVYEVRCHKVYPHGELDGHPTFGGVVLNHLMHGSSRVGTPLMPTLFCYAAFWGPGEVLKNGQVLDSGRLVHGMLTEYVRSKDYGLDFDRQVDPTHLMFHLIVPPLKDGEPDPVRTGFTLANGKELPFWHVMFDRLIIRTRHPETQTTFP